MCTGGKGPGRRPAQSLEGEVTRRCRRLEIYACVVRLVLFGGHDDGSRDPEQFYNDQPVAPPQ